MANEKNRISINVEKIIYTDNDVNRRYQLFGPTYTL